MCSAWVVYGGMRVVYGWYTDGLRVVYEWYMGGPWVVYGVLWVVHGWFMGGSWVVHGWPMCDGWVIVACWYVCGRDDTSNAIVQRASARPNQQQPQLRRNAFEYVEMPMCVMSRTRVCSWVWALCFAWKRGLWSLGLSQLSTSRMQLQARA